MMKKIQTLEKIVRHPSTNKLYYGARTIYKFKQENKGFTCVYTESLFDVEEIEDDEGNLKNVVTEIVEYKQEGKFYSNEEIRKLSSSITLNYNSGTDDIINFWDEVQIQGILIDTISQGEDGRHGTKNWIKYKY